ncbi:aldose 1-epimerase family protein [Flavobacterium sp. 3HN19-14]|uniref:aldose 1-epimerase family protein n=1 Tax=Flavobacterium sp. 3HN19-14 TaxID=3448133 RepID=UPI003EE0295E
MGTLKNNEYIFEDENYSLSRHGFARDMEFSAKETKADSVTFSLTSTEETIKNYPFRFIFEISYTLKEKGLIISYRVFNNDEKTMWFSLGAHPAFALPGNFEDYAIVFDNDENPEYHLLESDLISPKTSLLTTKNGENGLNYSMFENDALIFKKLQSKGLSILKNANPFLKVHFGNFPHLGIWTKANAPFLCIEPWFGHSDAIDSNGDFTQKQGIQNIGINGIFEAAFRIEIL